MEKVYLFLRKLVALGLNVLIFFLIIDIIPFYYSIPVLLIIFSLIVSRISGTVPKELYNYQRSEKYFAQGGLRDLLRIPVILFAFLHDIIVWAIWGLYQILELITETVFFIKKVVFWILHALIWFLKLLLPFWRIVYRMFIFYIIKWPWWIYRYSFNAIKKAYNWNVIKVSIVGAFIALFIFQLFYFLQISLEIYGLVYIGIILALLPVSWVFGEISSIRGQNLMFVPFREVKYKMQNGIESVRGLLFFITFFVVVLIAEVGLNLLGWIPRSGVVLLGFSLNINYLFNILLIFLAGLIIFGTFVLPTYRLYNEFNETSFKNIYSFFVHISKRCLQYIIGFIPSAFFAIVSIIPATVLVALAIMLTMQVKENTTNVKIKKLISKQSNAESQLADYQIGKEIDRMEYIAAFPKQFFQEVNHRALLKEELNDYKKQEKQYQLHLAALIDKVDVEVKTLNHAITTEQNKPVVNQTRIEELQQNIALLKKEFDDSEAVLKSDIAILNIDIQYASRKYKQVPILFYLSGLFSVVVLTLILTFALAYYGNFFYRAFLFRNDNTFAKWKDFIREEKTESKHQPLLSTTLNVIIILLIIVVIIQFGAIPF